MTGRVSIPGLEYPLLSASISNTQDYLIPGAIVGVYASVTSFVLLGFPLVQLQGCREVWLKYQITHSTCSNILLASQGTETYLNPTQYSSQLVPETVFSALLRCLMSWFASLTLLLALDSSQFGMDCHSNYRMCITFCSLTGKVAPLHQLSQDYIIRLQ